MIGTARRLLWSTEQRLFIDEKTLYSGEIISAVARRNGVVPNLPHPWRRLTSEEGASAVQADHRVAGNAGVYRLEARLRKLGRKALEVEILREALHRLRKKMGLLTASSSPRSGCRAAT